jgi:uncharacterized protein YdeI (BOF family)
MRKIMIATLLLLVSAWAVAQQGSTNPGSAAGSSQSQSQSQPGASSSQSGASSGHATPDAAQGSSTMASSGNVVEGCLGGSNPNFTVTDKSGNAYQIIVPQGADASPLQKHIGESVAVEGTVDNSGSASSSSGSGSAAGSTSAGQSSSASGHAIRATRIGRGTTQCPGSGGAGTGSNTSQKPPQK